MSIIIFFHLEGGGVGGTVVALVEDQKKFILLVFVDILKFDFIEGSDSGQQNGDHQEAETRQKGGGDGELETAEDPIDQEAKGAVEIATTIHHRVYSHHKDDGEDLGKVDAHLTSGINFLLVEKNTILFNGELF